MDAKQIQQITDRISQNLESKGVSPDKNSIFDKLSAYINDFGVVPTEAERKVLSDQYKKYEIPEEQKAVPSFSTANELRSIAEIQEGEWVTLEVKIVSLIPPRSAAISQGGIAADSSGAIEFVTFAKAADLPALEVEKWYRIESAIVDSFKGSLSLKMHSGSKITEITEERCLVPASPTQIAAIKTGVVPCLRAKFVDEWDLKSDKMTQTGLLADETGRLKFVTWKSSEKEKLNLGSVYTIYYASASEFNGKMAVSLDTAIWLEEDGDSMPAVSVKTKAEAPAEPLPVTSLQNLQAGYASVRVKFVESWECRSDRMLQSGLVGDESGRIKFVLWKDDAAKPLELNRVYTIRNAKVDEYNGRLSLSLNGAEIVLEDGDIEDMFPITPLHNLQAGYACVHVKFIEEWESRSERMLQTGLVGDESDRMKFVLWKDDVSKPLELNRVYTIRNAKVDEYNGRLSLSLNRAEIIAEDGSIEVGRTLEVLEGNLVQIAKGSGLIKRCPVEGCGRVLSKQNLCPVHEIQMNFNYDLRIRGFLDDGEKAHSILMNREITEALSGMALDAAIELGTSSPLGADEVQIQLTEKLGGRYMVCKGTWFNDLFIVQEAEFKKFDSNEITVLMNQAGNAGGAL
ncbi:MAG TPA: hypothetical protein O0X97_01170 [Methanocorpusculum sp.]|nr:hypothetical protein [Methanocorpusculum sp.]